MKNIIKTLLILSSVVILLGACTKKAAENTQHSPSVQANTAQTKTVVDHVGNTVEIPVNPQRIASLHTMSTSVMLIELGVDIIGTATRTKLPENQPYIRAVEELFEIKFEDTDYFNYGAFGKDIEQIKLSRPDLIIGTVKNEAQYEMLSSIAPTVLIDHYSPDMFKVYRDVATWVGKENIFEKHYQKYLKRVEKLRQQFTTDPATQTTVYLMARIDKGQLSVRQYYGSVTKVAYDLGLQRMEFVKQQFPDDDVGGNLSAEVVEEFANTDYILSTYRNQTGETIETVYENFDSVSPGWREIIKAYENDRFIVFHRELAYPSSFISYNYVLDEFEKYIK